MKLINYFRRMYYRLIHRFKKYPPYEPGEPCTITLVGGPWHGQERTTTTNIKEMRGYIQNSNPIDYNLKPQIDYDLVMICYRKSAEDPLKFNYEGIQS